MLNTSKNLFNYNTNQIKVDWWCWRSIRVKVHVHPFSSSVPLVISLSNGSYFRYSAMSLSLAKKEPFNLQSSHSSCITPLTCVLLDTYLYHNMLRKTCCVHHSDAVAGVLPLFQNKRKTLFQHNKDRMKANEYLFYVLLFLILAYGYPVRYIDQLSRSLSVEYKRYGVDVQCQVRPYSVYQFFLFFSRSVPSLLLLRFVFLLTETKRKASF
jgi:hypothetical protein